MEEEIACTVDNVQVPDVDPLWRVGFPVIESSVIEGFS